MTTTQASTQASTEAIIAELSKQLAEHVAAGKHVLASECRQQIVAHQTLERLRAEHAAHPSAGVASQIRFWERKLTPVTLPKKKRAEPAAEPAEPKPEQT